MPTSILPNIWALRKKKYNSYISPLGILTGIAAIGVELDVRLRRATSSEGDTTTVRHDSVVEGPSSSGCNFSSWKSSFRTIHRSLRHIRCYSIQL
ncbi:hypothetical protein ScPMuIL_008929 [Solemya velum]